MPSRPTIMTLATRAKLAFLTLITTLSTAASAQDDAAQFMNQVNARVAKAGARKTRWDGPVAGPKIQHRKWVVFIASDLHNSSLARLGAGVEEAASSAGWEVRNIDCHGSNAACAAAFREAIALKPDGIMLAGIEAREQTAGLNAAAAARIPVVGWHAAGKNGPTDGMFTNLGTDAKEVAQIAALFSISESNGTAGVVLLTDSSSLYAITKSNAMVDIIKRCNSCSLLGVEDLPLATAAAKMPLLLAGLVQRHGAKWTHVIGVNDLYFDLMTAPALAGLLARTQLKALSAGDGSASAYQRIRNKTLQTGTVPEPLNQHGWQLVDELNRAFAGEKPSGYSAPAHLVTNLNIAFEGGAKNTFDPDNGYREHYKKIWLP